MTIPKPVSTYLADNGYGDVASLQTVGGGCINNGARLRSASGTTFFLKTNPDAPADMFAREAEGLGALSVTGGPVVPRAYLHGLDYILLEDLTPAARCSDYWVLFGRQLAVLHGNTNPRYGFYHDNYIGSTPQPNLWTADGYEFFSRHRLLFQARLANRRGLLSGADVNQVERLAARLPLLIPDQPASLVHGDLWTGNAMTDRDGKPAIIDPAVHFGWAESELAMTDLFGSFPDAFYRAYQEVRPLEGDFRGRFPIYNLYHLLNHLNLFGGGYLGQVQSVLRRFTR